MSTPLVHNLRERPELGLRTFKGQAWARGLLRLMGWRLDFHGLPCWTEHGQTVSRGVIIAYPHTSNWDGVIGVLAIWGLGLKLRVWGKASLFRVPVLAQLLRAAGVVPVERGQAHGAVLQTAFAMANSNFYWQALAPEGTRKLKSGWRSGFYHLALEAHVPVLLATLDWGRKCVGVKTMLDLSGDQAQDMARIAAGFAGVIGHTPANQSPIALSGKLSAQAGASEASFF